MPVLSLDFAPIIESLLHGEDLSPTAAGEAMGAILDGEATPEAVAGFLIALRAKGAAASELANFVTELRKRARQVPNPPEGLVDTCGTGGGIPSFNLSTAAAIVASAAGACVAKHGNRAVTSACGSADVLEALGVRLVDDPAAQSRLLREVGLAFLFAPAHHPALGKVGPIRKALGVRTVFNQLGPLANPAGARVQVIGVYDPALAQSMAEAAAALGADKVWVVHGDDGMDEISPCTSTQVWDGSTAFRIGPGDFGVSPVDAAHVAPGATPAENAAMLREAISDARSPRSLAVMPGAAAALYLGGHAPSLREAAEMAREAVDKGDAARKLAAFVEATNAS